jgi:sugar O-acyltransferase (sialic acid O-acetyltransferase NeuD family)
MKPVMIFGTGSMARVLYSFLRKKCTVKAFVADDEFVTSNTFMGLPLFKYSELLADTESKFRIALAIGYHGMNKVRQQRFDELQRLGYTMKGYVHDCLIHHNDVIIDKPCVIYDNVAIHAGSKIGQNAFISSNVSIGHDCEIGAHAWINSGVSLAGGVKVGARCVLGINSCVAQGVTLGEGTFVGANTLVTQNTWPDSVIASPQGETINIGSERFTKLTRQP